MPPTVPRVRPATKASASCPQAWFATVWVWSWGRVSGQWHRVQILGPVNAMGTNALHGRKRPAQGAKAKAGRVPGETLQRSDGRFRQQPGGNGWHGAPLRVVLLAKTLGLRFVGRLDWHPMPAVRVCVHSVNRPQAAHLSLRRGFASMRRAAARLDARPRCRVPFAVRGDVRRAPPRLADADTVRRLRFPRHRARARNLRWSRSRPEAREVHAGSAGD